MELRPLRTPVTIRVKRYENYFNCRVSNRLADTGVLNTVMLLELAVLKPAEGL